ncbi:regulator of iron dicitrate transport [Bordetella ansorpii]|uniref:Regulator of iron dicitrate transport n=1 Tax=Bordetella ansorpii TaxID=288768 RepID=A0A157SGB5_9BORD|nr:FecR domain-containing protein [Bordetella ansorpii]SAI69488.1 regulator of iron dicitrate transport [Bordetella ansorpii]
MTAGALPPQALLEEAADWAVRLRFEAPGDAERQDFACWLARSEAHAQAWARAQSVLGVFDQVPASVAGRALRGTTLQRRGRRALLTLGLAAGPLAWLAWRETPWQAWTAQVTTRTGQRRDLHLDDGTLLTLNSGTAIDVIYTANERRVVLQSGEILVATARETSAHYRPFIVQTPQGESQALGTRFTVRLLDDRTRVAVYEHAVRVRPTAGQALRLEAGQQAEFDRRDVRAPSAADEGALAWRHGMLLARDMRMDALVEELGRYRPGVLRCDPDVAALRVSGALSLDDTDAALAALQAQLPVRVRRFSRYWVSVGPAA